MNTNIFYLFGIVVFIYNIGLIGKYNEMIHSVEWLSIYKSKGRKPDDKRVNYKLVNLWIISSFISSTWLFFGTLTDSWMLFMFLFLINIISNYILSKNTGAVKMKLAFIKTLVYNFILLTLLVNHFLF